MMRRVLFILAVVCLVAVVVLGLFPKLITDDYFDVTIMSIQIAPDGQASLSYEGRITAGTRDTFRIGVNGVWESYGGGAHGGLPAWPGKSSGTLEFHLDPERSYGKSRPDGAALAERVCVKVGETCRVRRNAPLTLFRFTTESGNVHEGRMEIERD